MDNQISAILHGVETDFDAESANARQALITAANSYKTSRYSLGRALSEYRAGFPYGTWLPALERIGGAIGIAPRTLRSIISDFEELTESTISERIEAVKETGIDPLSARGKRALNPVGKPTKKKFTLTSALKSVIEEASVEDRINAVKEAITAALIELGLTVEELVITTRETPSDNVIPFPAVAGTGLAVMNPNDPVEAPGEFVSIPTEPSTAIKGRSYIYAQAGQAGVYSTSAPNPYR